MKHILTLSFFVTCNAYPMLRQMVKPAQLYALTNARFLTTPTSEDMFTLQQRKQQLLTTRLKQLQENLAKETSFFYEWSTAINHTASAHSRNRKQELERDIFNTKLLLLDTEESSQIK